MNEPLISIIVPVYNTEKYIARCIKSILNQTYKSIELILVDDGSADNSPKICDEYAERDSRIKVIHKKNGGVSSARNAGLDIAKGDYVGFVDSDDFVGERMYELLYRAVQDRDDVISNLMFTRVFSDGRTAASSVPHDTDEIISKETFIKELLLHKGDASVCSKLFPRKVLKGKRFDESKLNEDVIFMFSLLKDVESISFVGAIGYYYYVREGSTTNAYGQAFCDMVENSLIIKDIVYSEYPALKKQADRFALVQHVEYLLHLPDNLANGNNELYVKALHYVRKNAFKNLFNRFLSSKYRVITLLVVVSPRIARRLRRKRKK